MILNSYTHEVHKKSSSKIEAFQRFLMTFLKNIHSLSQLLKNIQNNYLKYQMTIFLSQILICSTFRFVLFEMITLKDSNYYLFCTKMHANDAL